MAGPAGKGGWDLYSRGLMPSKKFFPYGKRGELILGSSQQSLAQLLSLLLQLSCLKNKPCDHINFLLKTLKILDFLSYWSSKMDMVTFNDTIFLPDFC